MAHSKPTQDVVQRVRPLLDRLATRTIDKARLLQYLSAMAGVEWGVLRLRERVVSDGGETLVFEDRTNGAEYRLPYPDALPRDLDRLVRDEYKRLALNRPLTLMSQPLFERFFAASHCARCRWRGPAHDQIHRECRFAGHPINFEPRDPGGADGPAEPLWD